MTFDPATDPNNLTGALWSAGSVPADLAALRADPAFGDGVMQTGTFPAWSYVILGDGTQTFYDDPAAVWVPGAAPPRLAYSGAVVADLPTVKEWIGAQSAGDDDNIDRALATATTWVYERTMRCDWDDPDVQLAVVMIAARLFQRRRSPEGVAGFGGDGVVVRVVYDDPEVRRLLERHLEMRTVGIG